MTRSTLGNRPTDGNPQVIDTRPSSGGIEDTCAIDLVEGSNPPEDISTATVELSLGTIIDGVWVAGTWLAPTVDIASGDACGDAATPPVLNVRTVSLKIGGAFAPPAGQYRLFSRLTDMLTGEVIVRQHYPITVLA